MDTECSQCGRDIEEHTADEAIVCIRAIMKKTGE